MSDLNIALILRLVDRVTGPTKKVMRQIEAMGGATERQGRRQVAWADRQIAASRGRMAGMQGEAMGLAAMGAGFVALTEPAIQAEKRMAEISKVVDFDAPDGFNILQKEIGELVTSDGLVMSAAAIADIVAAAGRMGVVDENLPDAQKRRELLEFASAAGKMAVAFGVSADEAGTTLARWRQNLGLTQAEAMLLGDTVNLLGNSMTTNEADIMQVINRQGVMAKTAGLAENEIAALSATLLAAGASPEIAATGMKNFLNAMTKGESVTKRQSDAFAEIGINAEELAQRMQVDAKGAILDVLDTLQTIDPARLNAVVGNLFGEEAKGAIVPIVDNAELLRETFEKTADSVALLGLVEEEYLRQAATTTAQRKLLWNWVERFSVVIGNHLLPMLNEMMATVAPLIAQAIEWAEANPELIKTLGWVAAGLFGVKLASLALRWPLELLIGGGFRLVRMAGFAAIGLGKLARGFGLLASLRPLRWGRLIPRLRWTRAIIPAIRWIALAGLLPWGRLVRALSWTRRFVPAIAWRTLAGMLAWGRLIRPLRWSRRFIPAITWRTLAGMLAWGRLIRPLIWSRRLIPAIKWGSMGLGALTMTKGGWGMLVKPLVWAAKTGLRLIPVIGWALLAYDIGKFAWSFLGLDMLPWRTYIEQVIDWKNWVFNFKWTDHLPDWLWTAIVGQKILWGAVWDFVWTTFLPDWTWDWIPTLDLTGKLTVSASGLTRLWRKIGSPAGAEAVSKENPTPRKPAARGVTTMLPTAAPLPASPAGGRALGGAVRAGFMYRVNELGHEMFSPGQSGSIVPHRMVRHLAEKATIYRDMAAQLTDTARDRIGDIRILPAAAAPAFAQAAAPSRGPVSLTIGDIVIQAGPGDSPARLARQVRHELTREMRDLGVGLHDGGGYND